ncbi:DUF6543 domain-containing protein [Pseudomonas sp.]|uniref:dermonecrotic toxin domain-containing protein n=1 Tax=Pseudomonas sp. TaxID=306 RepID=UPI00261917C3|nr:DUF6543 domain-containing protein [Pseudomonas sp.]
MPLQPTPPADATPFIPTQNAVRAEFDNPPTLESVARQMLAAAIAEHYPTLIIDLTRTRLAVPIPGGGWALHPFMPKVMDYLGNGTELDLTPVSGQPYYLVDEAPNWLRLPAGELNMKVIATLVKELAWRLPIGLQNSLNDYWKQPSSTGASRWRWLSDVIRDTLTLGALKQKDLDSDAREAINQIIQFPEREARVRQFGERAVSAYWLKVTLRNNGVVRSVLSERIVLATAKQVMSFKPDGTTRTYKDLNTLSLSWVKRISERYAVSEIRSKHFELEGNVFDAAAAALLNRHLERIAALTLPTRIGAQALQTLYRKLLDTSDFFADAPPANRQQLAPLKANVPDWLENASPNDRALYRQYSVGMARAKKNSRGHTYLNGISGIHTYAVDVLQQLLQRDQKQFEPGLTEPHAPPHPDDIQLTFHVATGVLNTIGIIEPVTLSLTELALKNLVGRPTGRLTLGHRLGLALPAWLTPDYITQRDGLIEQANIGKAYPERLESLLLSNTPASQEREKLFAEQMNVQLPLEALELSLKKANGMTPLGARYVAAVVQPGADERVIEGQPVVIRRLALIRKPEAVPDVVSNMFIIEPSNTDHGPHVLYRPFYAKALLEFPTRDALLKAMAEPGELQDSILIWLSDAARPIYANGGIKEPHYVRFGLGSEFAPLEVPAPAALATDGISHELLQYLLNGQLMLFLYGCNARALVDQANTDSVSNRESRWRVFFEGTSLVFNSLLLAPALPRALMITGGLLGLANTVSQAIPALSSRDPATRELAIADVLLNVGMMLFHYTLSALPRLPRVASRMARQTLRPLAPAHDPQGWPAPSPPKIITGLVALAGEFPNTDSTVLDFRFASARNHLTAGQIRKLAEFKIARPAALPPAQATGVHKGLYRIADRWCALIDNDLYPVEVDLKGGAIIVSSTDPSHLGPRVKSDINGLWTLDLGMSLQGGMPPRRIAALKQKKAARLLELQTELDTFFKEEETLHKTVETTLQILEKASDDPRYTAEQLTALRERLDTALQKQLSAYQKLLDTRQERLELQAPFHEKVVISLLEKAFDNRATSLSIPAKEQRILLRKWPQFSTLDARMEAASEADPKGFEQFIREQITINDRAIERIEMRNGYLDELFNLSEAGAEAAAPLTSQLPREEHSPLSLKSLQLECLKMVSSSTTASTLVEDSLDQAIDPLKEHLHTHIEVTTLALETSRRVEVLDSLVEHYGQALDALQGIRLMSAESLEMTYFDKLGQLLDSLYQDATKLLAAEIKPALKPRKRPEPRPPSGAGIPQRKVIKARGKGTLIGNVRPADGQWPMEVIEVHSGYDKQLLSTYSQHGDEWVEIQTLHPKPAAPLRALNIIKGDARKLFGQFDKHLSQVRQYRALCRHPVEIQEQANNEARKLDRLASELHNAVQAEPAASRLPADQTLIDDMRSAAQRLTQEGETLRIQLSLELPPTHGNLQYLLDQKRVQIAALGERIKLQGERQDFIQEYAVNDRDGAPLWYAHFHYPALDTPAPDYAVAHLKTKAQRKLSYFSQLADAHSGQAIVNVHRGQIGKNLAERWFLPLVMLTE